MGADAEAQSNAPHQASGNFYALEEAFDSYFQGKDLKRRGIGYKPYKRWQWMWEPRVTASGAFPDAVAEWKEWQRYITSRKQVLHKTAAADSSNWTSQGPFRTGGGYEGIGRLNCVAFHPTDSNTFWVGSPGGGLWKTSDAGQTWTTYTDNLPVMGVSEIVINPQNPNTMYIATGDRDASDTYSVGVLKSTDGGVNWQLTGMQYLESEQRKVNRLIMMPSDTSKLIAATSAGIFVSYDAAATWHIKAAGARRDLALMPGKEGYIYAAASNAIYFSPDTGNTWQLKQTFNGVTRTNIAVSPAAPAKVMAITSNFSYGLEGIYASTDTGQVWNKLYEPTGANCEGNFLAHAANANACGGQGWYDLTLAMNPNNADEVVAGGVNTWMSGDGGLSWDIRNQWTQMKPGLQVVHADKHFHTYHPYKPNWIMECNDGGLYISKDNGDSWTDLSNGLVITQFYRISVATQAGVQKVLGGAQDNGTFEIQPGVGSVSRMGGDGMECIIDYSDTTIMYGSYQYGSIRNTMNNWGNSSSISNNIPGQPEGNWVTPYAQDLLAPETIYAGYRKLYKSFDYGQNWMEISNNFSNNIDAFAVAPSNPNYIYVLAGNIVSRTIDGGQTWNNITSGFPNNTGTKSGIAVHPDSVDVVYVTCSNYINGMKVIRRNGKTNKWENVSGTLPNFPVNCLVINKDDKTVYVGTDHGVYYRDWSMTDWAPYITNLPNVKINELELKYSDSEIWAATYGRGLWKSPIHVAAPLPTGIKAYDKTARMQVYPNPTAGKITVAVNTGTQAMVQLELIGMDGRRVFSTEIAAHTPVTLDWSSIAKGSYVLRARAGSQHFEHKVVLQ